VKTLIKLLFAVLNGSLSVYALFVIFLFETDLLEPVPLLMTLAGGACLSINLLYFFHRIHLMIQSVRDAANQKDHFHTGTEKKKSPLPKTVPLKN
jgi:hypothetical protein